MIKVWSIKRKIKMFLMNSAQLSAQKIFNCSLPKLSLISRPERRRAPVESQLLKEVCNKRLLFQTQAQQSHKESNQTPKQRLRRLKKEEEEGRARLFRANDKSLSRITFRLKKSKLRCSSK